MAKIITDDEVIVIAGKDLGKRGKIREVLEPDSVIVSGVNIKKRHTRPNPQMGVAGGIVEKEAPIHLSNVAIFNPSTGLRDRVGYKVGDGKKVRIFKSSGEEIGS